MNSYRELKNNLSPQHQIDSTVDDDNNITREESTQSEEKNLIRASKYRKRFKSPTRYFSNKKDEKNVKSSMPWNLIA